MRDDVRCNRCELFPFHATRITHVSQFPVLPGSVRAQGENQGRQGAVRDLEGESSRGGHEAPPCREHSALGADSPFSNPVLLAIVESNRLDSYKAAHPCRHGGGEPIQGAGPTRGRTEDAAKADRSLRQGAASTSVNAGEGKGAPPCRPAAPLREPVTAPLSFAPCHFCPGRCTPCTGLETRRTWCRPRRTGSSWYGTA